MLRVEQGTDSWLSTSAPVADGLDALASGWSRVPIARIEDLQDAVLGAHLEAVQMSLGAIHGGLAYAQDRGITYSSGLLGGHVTLSGPLSETMLTVGVGLNMAPGARHWLNEVPNHAVGVFRAGDMHEAIYTPGTLYATATLEPDQLEEIAGDQGLVLDTRQLGSTRISDRRMDERRVAPLEQCFLQLHDGRRDGGLDPDVLGRRVLDALIAHLSREPRQAVGLWAARQHGRIVERARRYILDNLEQPLSIDAIAKAAFTSHRTLHRAFGDVLDETPQSYVRKLRLNRIRHELATDREAICTITIIANRWGISELGRLSGWYRELFGELPSETKARPYLPRAVQTLHLAESA